MKYGIIELITENDYKKAKLYFIEGPEMTLDIMQDVLGGLIERVPIEIADENNIDIWVNEEGKILNLDPTVVVKDSESSEMIDMLAGPILITGTDGEGKTIALNEKQIEIIKKMFELDNMCKVIFNEDNSKSVLFNLDI